ncbi:MAG: hypothetical protein ACI8ZW_000990 [Yoonia sp.]|jgi:hypothetical protein
MRQTREKSIQTTKGQAERTAELLREKICSGEPSNEGKIPSFAMRSSDWIAIAMPSGAPDSSF